MFHFRLIRVLHTKYHMAHIKIRLFCRDARLGRYPFHELTLVLWLDRFKDMNFVPLTCTYRHIETEIDGNKPTERVIHVNRPSVQRFYFFLSSNNQPNKQNTNTQFNCDHLTAFLKQFDSFSVPDVFIPI